MNNVCLNKHAKLSIFFFASIPSFLPQTLFRTNLGSAFAVFVNHVTLNIYFQYGLFLLPSLVPNVRRKKAIEVIRMCQEDNHVTTHEGN